MSQVKSIHAITLYFYTILDYSLLVKKLTTNYTINCQNLERKYFF
jgi:hypothetical protein